VDEYEGLAHRSNQITVPHRLHAAGGISDYHFGKNFFHLLGDEAELVAARYRISLGHPVEDHTMQLEHTL
jgi:hypothetical protein